MRKLVLPMMMCAAVGVALSSGAQTTGRADMDPNSDGLVTRGEWRAAAQETALRIAREPSPGREVTAGLVGARLDIPTGTSGTLGRPGC